MDQPGLPEEEPTLPELELFYKKLDLYFSFAKAFGCPVDEDRLYDTRERDACAQLLRPTATLFIDVSPELALARIAQNRERTELFETRERLTRTREQYFKAFALEKDRETVIFIHGDRDVDAVSEEIWQAVSTLLPAGA